MWLVLVVLAVIVHGAIHEYDGVVLPKDTLMYRRSGMFLAKRKNTESFIKVDLKLTRAEDAPPLQDLEGEKLKDDGVGRIDRTFPITSTGLKYLLISSCNELTGSVVLDGKTEWKNPFGYLPGELHGFLPFTLGLAITYVGIGLVWAVLSFWHWRELMILQTYVTVVLGLSMMEMTFRYYDYSQFNAHGSRSTELMLWASMLHTMKQTVSRMLVLIVSMGFGIVKPSLGDSANTVWGLGGLFFFFSMIQRVYELSAHTSAVTFMQYVTMLPVASLDLVFFVWIFRSLSEVMSQLEAKTSVGKENAKLELYRKFRRVLYFTMLVACVWSLVYLFIVVSGQITREWKTRWLFDGFFDLEYLLVLLAIMFLWRPTNNATQFAYAKVPVVVVANNGGEEDEEEYGAGLEEEAKKY
ncbi:hypothetical protein BASA81_016525 [Batrachochytrium salamandrivorans]|nr:hypothetical protein BASA81_016525 [Batrachochytrium salamandrivorans]